VLYVALILFIFLNYEQEHHVVIILMHLNDYALSQYIVMTCNYIVITSASTRLIPVAPSFSREKIESATWRQSVRDEKIRFSYFRVKKSNKKSNFYSRKLFLSKFY